MQRCCKARTLIALALADLNSKGTGRGKTLFGFSVESLKMLILDQPHLSRLGRLCNHSSTHLGTRWRTPRRQSVGVSGPQYISQSEPEKQLALHHSNTSSPADFSHRGSGNRQRDTVCPTLFMYHSSLPDRASLTSMPGPNILHKHTMPIIQMMQMMQICDNCLDGRS